MLFSKCIYPKSIFAKCTRLAYLLRFASFFSPKPRTPVANFGMWLKMDGHEWKLIKVDEMAKDCRKWMRPISPNGDGPWNLNRGSSMTIKTPWKLILWNKLCPLFQLFHESYSEMQSASLKIKDDSCDVSGAASDSKFGASEPDFPSKSMERSRNW